MWSQIEPSAAIFCACLVTYRPLFRKLRLPGFIVGASKSTNPSDVSRRWPTMHGSEEGSEAVLVKQQDAMGYSKAFADDESFQRG